MPGHRTMCIVILYLVSLFYPSSATAFTVGAIQSGAPSHGAAAKPPSKSGPNIVAPVHQRDVVNIVVDKIEGASIHSTDGRTFEVPSSVKVINNSHRSRMRIAELVFENGSLVAVSIK